MLPDAVGEDFGSQVISLSVIELGEMNIYSSQR